MAAAITIKNLSLNLGAFSLKDINFKVEDGDYFILLGKSGSGKSLILETIAGLIKPDQGQIILYEKDITEQRIQEREVGIVFQDFAIFPHLSVRENIAYSLKKRKISHQERNHKVEVMADRTGISHLLSRKPTSLSGGELQRVALARTLITEPECLLLDEPLSALDIEIRHELRTLLRELNRQGQTIIHVTHDYEEAFALGSHVGILHDGSIIQTGTLKEVFHTPRSHFVAKLTGIKNFFNAQIIDDGRVLAEQLTELSIIPVEEKGEGCIYFRAEDVILSHKKIPSSLTNQLKGLITGFVPTPMGIEVVVDAGIKIIALITSLSYDSMQLKEGHEIWVSFKASAVKYIGHQKNLKNLP